MKTITTEEELRAEIGHPGKLAEHKVIAHIDQHCREFIAMSPFLIMSTSNNKGMCDSSPRGDSPGFVYVLDEKHVVIPERPGNRRADSILNIFENPHAGLLFLIPGLEETLRINGKASITSDSNLLKLFEVQGKLPKVAIVIEVEECFIHCAKALKRSSMWQPATWEDKENLPSPAKMMASHAKLPEYTEKAVNESLAESYTKRMY